MRAEERWSSHQTMCFLWIASGLNRLGIKARPFQVLKVLVPLLAGTWICLALALYIIGPELTALVRQSLPGVPDIPELDGEYYLWVLALVPLWFDVLSRLSTIFLGKTAIEKIQVDVATIQALDIQRRVYHAWTHRISAILKALFCLLPLVSLTLWAFQNHAVQALSMLVMSLYLLVVLVEDWLSLRRLSNLPAQPLRSLWFVIARASCFIVAGVLSVGGLLDVVSTLGRGAPRQEMPPITHWVLTQLISAHFAAIASIMMLVASLAVARASRRESEKPMGLMVPVRRPLQHRTVEHGLLFPIVGIGYLSFLLSSRKNLLILFLAGGILAASPMIALPESWQLTAVIAAVSFLIGSSFEESIKLGFTRHRLRYRFFYEAGCAPVEIIVKLHLSVLLSALPQIILCAVVLTTAKVPVTFTVLIMVSPAVLLISANAILSAKVRNESLCFTLVALVQALGSMALVGVAHLSLLAAFICFLALVAISYRTSQKALLCLT